MSTRSHLPPGAVPVFPIRPAPPPPVHIPRNTHQRPPVATPRSVGVAAAIVQNPNENVQQPEREVLLGRTVETKKSGKSQSRSKRIYLILGAILVISILLLIGGIVLWNSLQNSTEESSDLIEDISIGTTPLPTTPKILTEMEKRQEFVKTMAREAWESYSKYAWGHDGVRPVTREPFDDLFGNHSGLGIVSALGTLWILGLKEEFTLGRKWVEASLNFSSIKKEIDVQQAVTYYVGSLLSVYSLTGDEMFLNRSVEIANLLDPAYRSQTGLPYWKLKPAAGIATYRTPFLSSVGGQQLEYRYLYALTGNRSYLTRAQTVRTRLAEIDKPYGLYMHQIDVETGTWHISTASLFTTSRAFFAGLLKSYIMSNRVDIDALETYNTALEAIHKSRLLKISSTGFLYVRNYNLNVKFHIYEKYMNVDACALGALFSLGARELADRYPGDSQLHWEWARGIVKTCTTFANETATRLAPYRFYFDYKEEDEVNMVDSGRYVLSPELAESYFILWRLTHDSQYRQAAWQLAQSLHAHTRIVRPPGTTTTTTGYTRLKDVNELPPEPANRQDVDLLSATLKYLYLTFADDEELDLDQWVFNERGQPLPVCGRNQAWKDCK